MLNAKSAGALFCVLLIAGIALYFAFPAQISERVDSGQKANSSAPSAAKPYSPASNSGTKIVSVKSKDFTFEMTKYDDMGPDENYKRVMAHMGRTNPDAAETMERTRQRYESAFESEKNARAELKNLRDCMSREQPLFPAEFESQLPPEARAEIASLKERIKADCLSVASRLAGKFPALQNEYRTRILKLATKKVLAIKEEFDRNPNRGTH